MATDSSFLDQLADVEVPVAPPDFQRQVHRRLNHWLLVVHIADMIAGAFPYAVQHYAQAVNGLIRLTLSGNYPEADPED
jgi:hypothetical protein